VVTKEKTAKNTQTIAHYSYKSPEGKKESVAVITEYYPKQIIYPFAKIDRRIDGKLMRAATIAQERAHAHSRSMCWHYVKEALLASGVIDSRPKSELAKDAAQDLVSNYGFKKLSVSDPFATPVGSVLVLWRQTTPPVMSRSALRTVSSATSFRKRHHPVLCSASTRSCKFYGFALQFGRLWYAEPNAISNAVGYAKFYSRSHDAVIRVYDTAGNVIETHEHAGEFREPNV
jgi:hypothetical protein